MRTTSATQPPKAVALVAALALVLSACQQATPAPSQGPATVQTITAQSAQMQPAPAGAPSSGWETAEANRGQLRLLAKLDSSGDAAWDQVKHPTVFFTTMAQAVPPTGAKIDGVGFMIVDAYSKEVVASRAYDLGEPITTYSHTMAVSPDGKWGYFMFSDQVAATKEARNLIGIVNTRTLKLDKVLIHPTQRLHHAAGFKDSKGNDRVIFDMGFGATGGPHFVIDPKNDNKVVQAITFDDVRPMGHPWTAPSPDGKYIYISMGSPEIRENEAYAASIAKFDLEKKAAIVISGVGNHPIGIYNTVDGKFTYVVDAEGSKVFKIDNSSNQVVARTSAGVAGPYGIRANWDETLLFTVGKGEGSHNRGSVLGVIDTKTFTQKAPPGVSQMPIELRSNTDDGGVVASVDHANLHPDPSVNELWVTNMAGNEVIVLDLNTYKVKSYIRTPNGGNTHGGAFVKYDKDWNGELLGDQFGPGPVQAKLIKEKAAAAQPAKPAGTAPAATQAAAAAPAPAAGGGAARKVTVSATNDRYSIATLDVRPSEKVEFVMTNTGDEKHNLVGLGGVSLVSPDFDAGQTVSWTWTAPDKPTTFNFQCSYHKNVPPIAVTVK